MRCFGDLVLSDLDHHATSSDAPGTHDFVVRFRGSNRTFDNHWFPSSNQFIRHRSQFVNPIVHSVNKSVSQRHAKLVWRGGSLFAPLGADRTQTASRPEGMLLEFVDSPLRVSRDFCERACVAASSTSRGHLFLSVSRSHRSNLGTKLCVRWWTGRWFNERDWVNDPHCLFHSSHQLFVFLKQLQASISLPRSSVEEAEICFVGCFGRPRSSIFLPNQMFSPIDGSPWWRPIFERRIGKDSRGNFVRIVEGHAGVDESRRMRHRIAHFVIGFDSKFNETFDVNCSTVFHQFRRPR